MNNKFEQVFDHLNEFKLEWQNFETEAVFLTMDNKIVKSNLNHGLQEIKEISNNISCYYGIGLHGEQGMQTILFGIFDLDTNDFERHIYDIEDLILNEIIDIIEYDLLNNEEIFDNSYIEVLGDRAFNYIESDLYQYEIPVQSIKKLLIELKNELPAWVNEQHIEQANERLEGSFNNEAIAV